MNQSREERERLQLRYNELGLSLVIAQEELEEARTLAGVNAEVTANMARQISVLIEDQSLRRQELEGLRRQLEASTTSALDAQSRLQAYSDGTGRTTLSASCMLAAVTEGNEIEDPGTGEDRPQRLSGRRSRDRDDLSRDRPHRSSGSRRSRGRDDFRGDRPQRLSGTRRPRDQDDDDESRSYHINHLDQDDPRTRTRAEVIEQGGPGDQVNRPPPLHHQPFRRGKQDLYKDWLLPLLADGKPR